jgi:hypothetical protein
MLRRIRTPDSTDQPDAGDLVTRGRSRLAGVLFRRCPEPGDPCRAFLCLRVTRATAALSLKAAIGLELI